VKISHQPRFLAGYLGKCARQLKKFCGRSDKDHASGETCSGISGKIFQPEASRHTDVDEGEVWTIVPNDPNALSAVAAAGDNFELPVPANQTHEPLHDQRIAVRDYHPYATHTAPQKKMRNRIFRPVDKPRNNSFLRDVSKDDETID
jgi:hypothetical protein